jgi:hypothetical protein
MALTTPSEIFWTIIAGGGGGGLIAFLMLKALGGRWLDGHFDKRLQSLKHEHDRDLEALRFGISEMLDRANKLNAREFEVMPQAWALVFDAYVETNRLLMRLKSTPDFSNMSPKVLEYTLEQSELVEWEKDELLQLKPRDRTLYYSRRTSLRELSRAKSAAQAADFFLSKNSLFLDREVHRRLKRFVEETWAAIHAHEFVQQAREDRGPMDFPRDDDDFRENADQRIEKLERFIRGRFWSESANANPKAVAAPPAERP